MSNYDNTRNVPLVYNEIGDGYYANSFYGTYDHFQRIGWYFDKVVTTIEDLDNCRDILTGRFVFVLGEDAIFMRDNAYDEDPFTYELRGDLHYNQQTGTFDFIDEEGTIEIYGFRFIGYATRRAKLLIDEQGNYLNIDLNEFAIPYKIASTKSIQQLSAYYFPTDRNAHVFKQSNLTPVQEIQLDKDKYEDGRSYIIK